MFSAGATKSGPVYRIDWSKMEHVRPDLAATEAFTEGADAKHNSAVGTGLSALIARSDQIG